MCPFYLFPLPIALSKNSSTIMNKSEKCLISDFRGNVFSFPQLNIMLAIGPSCKVFIILRYNSIPSFFRDFYHERILNFVNFLAYVEIILRFLSLILFMGCIMLIDLPTLNLPCILQ
jgi:hypothetical protein